MSDAENHRNKNIIQELTDSNEEFENYFQSTITAQLFIDSALTLRKYSPAAAKSFNLSPNDIGKHLKELTIHLKHISIDEFILEIMKTNLVIEKEIQTSDDKWFRMNIIPFFKRKENKTNGVIITFVDINNYVITLKELQKLNSEYETFIYSVSHDLKGPLNNIEGLISSLKDSSEKKSLIERNQILGMLDDSAKKMREMITELSKISREQSLGSGETTIIEVEDVFQEVLLTLKDKIEESEADIKTDFERKEISIQRKSLRSILYNLVSNAIKYHSPERKPAIIVKTENTSYGILLTVKDNGRGIEEDKKKVIFSQFGRVISNVEGTGVGLYLVSKIVDNLGGKIEVNSKVNEGSEFKISLKTSN